MRIGYLDCFSGVAGDMWVGAVVDAGVSIEVLRNAVQSLDLPGVAIRAERVQRCSLAGTRFVVEVGLHAEPDQGPATVPGATLARGAGILAAGASSSPRLGGVPHVHRRLAEIEAIVGRAHLPDAVRADCVEVYRKIAAAEAKAHGCDPQQVHFHEVGAEDTIVDVVCACLGTHLLGIERLYSSAVAVGSGTVHAAHGVLPVPAPGTLELLLGIPIRHGGLTGERTTPTGAALLAVLVDEFEPQVDWVPTGSGYGAGTRDDAGMPNLLRLTLGEVRSSGARGSLLELQCHLDTATGETIGWLLEELPRRGAVDAFATPVHMKKGRPGFLLTVLCDDASVEPVTAFLLEESSTLGVRRHRVARATLERWQETRATEFGPVRYKVARLPSGVLAARPEDDELRRLCAERGLARGELQRRLAR
jgi:hypothetical protein